jgi:hypothetical protein
MVGARKGARSVADRQDHFGRIFYNMARMSALGMPQISVVHGISVAGGAYMPAMSDVVIIVKVRLRWQAAHDTTCTRQSLSARIAAARILCIKVQELTQPEPGPYLPCWSSTSQSSNRRSGGRGDPRRR